MQERLITDEQCLKMALDATECPIVRPLDWNTQHEYYSGKKKKHTIKYEVRVTLSTGRIVWMTGGLPGSVHDITMARNSGILNQLLPGELILADKEYIGEDYFVTPFKNPSTNEEWTWNHFIHTTRVIVENIYSRIKAFGCLKQQWRHELTLHPIVFSVICNIVNIELYLHPLRK